MKDCEQEDSKKAMNKVNSWADPEDSRLRERAVNSMS